jgi:DNA polymerase-3 subunit delta
MPTAFEFLANPDKYPVKAFCVLYGDEPLLARDALAVIDGRVLAGEDAEFSRVAFSGEKTANPQLEWRTVVDELSTSALFGGGQRLVIIDNADDFVSRSREQLESYAAKPSSSGVLVLIVRTWPSNTKLYKAIAASGLPIECKIDSEDKLPRWLSLRAEQKHQAKLTADAAEQLLQIIGPELGRLDQELEKLSLIALAEQGIADPVAAAAKAKLPTITVELVNDNVGGWRAKTAWELSDKMNAGDTARALEQLGRLIESGEEPIALLAQVSSSLRKYAAATRGADLATLENRRVDLKSLLTEAGMKVWPAALQSAEVHLKQLTRPRGRQLLSWLLDADLALKGQSSSGHRARFVLEQLIVRLGRQTAPRA